MMTLLALLMVVAYAGSALSFLLFLIVRSRASRAFGMLSSGVGFVSHTVFLIARTVITGVPPFANLYESLLLFAWAIVLIFMIVLYRHGLAATGALVMPLAFLLTGAAALLDDSARPLMPALQSPWLYAHVLTCFLSYACFACAFCLGIMYLAQERLLKAKRLSGVFGRLPPLDTMDRINYQSVLAGFLLLTVGIVTGSLWAERAWGTWWSWDPKETWSLITWLIYAAYLHTRYLSGWRGRKTALLSIAGFACVLFTFLGVSFLLPGLHAYL